MTTVPGHNQILPQSTKAQELSQQQHAPKPSPDQAAALQQAQQNAQNTSVQGSEESVRLKEQKEKRKDRQAREAEKKKKKRQKEEMALDPEATGRLLDTTA